MIEEWRDVPKTKGMYQASNLGRIRSLNRIEICKNNHKRKRKGRLLKQYKKKTGYLQVEISGLTFLVHRLVAATFIGKIKNKVINHKDYNKENNNISNLEITTQKENVNYSIKRISRGSHHVKSKLNEKQAKEIKKTKLPLKYGDLSKIARKYKVSPATIRDIFVGNTWTHV